jgi:hypothetical protein
VTHVGDAVRCDRVGSLVFLDADTPSPEVAEGRSDVWNAPGHLGLGIGGADRAERHDQLRTGAGAEDDAVAFVLTQDLQPQGVAVESPTGVEIRRQQDREDRMIPSIARTPGYLDKVWVAIIWRSKSWSGQ